MTGISSTLSDSSVTAVLPNPAASTNFKNLSAVSSPRAAMRTAGGTVLVASTLTLPAPSPSLLEEAVAQLRWLAQAARPLAGQALRTMIATWGSATALAGELMALGRPIAMAVYELAVAFGEADLAAALAIPLGIAAGLLGVTATSTQSDDMGPPSARNPPLPTKTDRGNPRTDPATPTKPTQTSKSTPAIRPASPSADQARQNRASLTAATTLTRANAATPTMYAAVEKFYEIASGGRAARANGSLAVPMQAVRDSRATLNAAIVESEKQIAASAPQDRNALKNWHDSLVKARGSIDTWIASADAFSAGLSRPGGTRTTQPPLPRPPSNVVNAPSSPRSGPQVAQQLNSTYESANTAMRTGAAKATSTLRPVASTAPDRAQAEGAAQARTARELLAQTDPITARMNKGVEAFYQQAAGGKAARRNGSLAESLHTVTESKAELNKLILASNKSIAASSPADYPALDRWRTKLREARDAIDAWLPKANACAAGLSGPGGKPVALPALPAVPSVVVGAGGENNQAAAASLARAHDSAGKAIHSSGTVETTKPAVGTGTPSTVADEPITIPGAPNISFVPADGKVENAVAVWLNPDTGKVSRTPQTGGGWFEAQASEGGILHPPRGGTKSPGSAIVHVPKTRYDNLRQWFGKFRPPKAPKPPKIDSQGWLLIGIGLGTIFGGGSVAVQVYQGGINERNRENDAKVAAPANIALKSVDRTDTYKNAQAKADVYYDTWVAYLDQGEELLKANGVADQNSVGDGKYLAAFRADKADFLKTLGRKRDALKAAKDIDVVNNLLAQYLKPDALRFSPRNFGLPTLEKYKGTELRPQSVLVQITKAINDKTTASLTGIEVAPITDPVGKKQLDQLNESIKPAPAVNSGVAPAAPSTQTPRTTTTPSAQKIPATAASPPVVKTPTPPAKPAIDAAAAARANAQALADAQAIKAAAADRQRVTKGVADAHASVSLKRPTDLDDLKFNVGIFLKPSDRQNPDAIREQILRVKTLFAKLEALRLSPDLRDEATKTKLLNAVKSLAALTFELQALHTQATAQKSRATPPVPTAPVKTSQVVTPRPVEQAPQNTAPNSPVPVQQLEPAPSTVAPASPPPEPTAPAEPTTLPASRSDSQATPVDQGFEGQAQPTPSNTVGQPR